MLETDVLPKTIRDARIAAFGGPLLGVEPVDRQRADQIQALSSNVVDGRGNCRDAIRLIEMTGRMISVCEIAAGETADMVVEKKN